MHESIHRKCGILEETRKQEKQDTGDHNYWASLSELHISDMMIAPVCEYTLCTCMFGVKAHGNLTTFLLCDLSSTLGLNCKIVFALNVRSSQAHTCDRI